MNQPVKQPYLFLDDSYLSEKKGVSRFIGSPVKAQTNPVVRPEHPWEGVCVILWGSVLWDAQDELYKMWYEAFHPEAAFESDQTLLCYAYSRDGLTWYKPQLNLIEYHGSKANNIVFRGQKHFDTATVMLDPFNPMREQRFKMMLYDSAQNSFVTFASSDGLTWQQLGLVDLPIKTGDRHSLMADCRQGCWRIYFKYHEGMRTVHTASSTDFGHWHYQGEVLKPDADDPPEMEFYGLIGFNYEGQALGFLERFDILTRRLDTELVRLDAQGCPHRLSPRQIFLNRGPWPQWDSQWVVPAQSAPIRFGEEIRIYYQGRSGAHWSRSLGHRHPGAIGLARLRPDGWVYLQGQGQAASLTTVPLELTGHFICINADAQNTELRVELLDEQGQILPGFSASDCYPLHDDTPYFKLNWQGQSNLEKLLGKRLRLRFYLPYSKLYAFRFSDRWF